MMNSALIFLTLIVYSNAKFSCTQSTYCTIFIWTPWSDCSSGCGHGLRYRMPGMCCPNGVTAETIFAECAVKLCNMTDRDYNQTETCQSTEKCSTATLQTMPFSTKLLSTKTGTSPPTRSTQTSYVSTTLQTMPLSTKLLSTKTGTSPPTQTSYVSIMISLTQTARSSMQAFPSPKKRESLQEKKMALPNPFGIVTLLVVSALLLVTLGSVVTCVVFGVKQHKRRNRHNSIKPSDG